MGKTMINTMNFEDLSEINEKSLYLTISPKKNKI